MGNVSKQTLNKNIQSHQKNYNTGNQFILLKGNNNCCLYETIADRKLDTCNTFLVALFQPYQPFVQQMPLISVPQPKFQYLISVTKWTILENTITKRKKTGIQTETQISKMKKINRSLIKNQPPIERKRKKKHQTIYFHTMFLTQATNLLLIDK